MAQLHFPLWLGVAVVAAMFSPGCSCDGDETPSTLGPTEGAGAGTGGEDGTGGGSVTSSSGGAGGRGGGLEAERPASEMVTAGEVAKSTNFRMVFTLGQPTQNQQTTTSPGYRMQGGLVGANGSLP